MEALFLGKHLASLFIISLHGKSTCAVNYIHSCYWGIRKIPIVQVFFFIVLYGIGFIES